MTARLDGNAMAGIVRELFGQEMTLATGVCRSCGATSILAELHVYMTAGVVARCPACGAVVLRVVEGRDRVWIDLGGLSTLELSR